MEIRSGMIGTCLSFIWTIVGHPPWQGVQRLVPPINPVHVGNAEGPEARKKNVFQVVSGHVELDNLGPGPLHIVHTAVAIVGDNVEECLGEIEIAQGTADTAVHDGGRIGSTIETGDLHHTIAERVVVGIAGRSQRIEHVLGDGDNVVSRDAGHAASTQAWLVVGDVSGVAGACVGRAIARISACSGGRRGSGGCGGCGSGGSWRSWRSLIDGSRGGGGSCKCSGLRRRWRNRARRRDGGRGLARRDIGGKGRRSGRSSCIGGRSDGHRTRVAGLRAWSTSRLRAVGVDGLHDGDSLDLELRDPHDVALVEVRVGMVASMDVAVNSRYCLSTGGQESGKRCDGGRLHGGREIVTDGFRLGSFSGDLEV